MPTCSRRVLGVLGIAVSATVHALATAQTPTTAPSARMGRDSLVDRMIEATVQIRCLRANGTIPMGSGVVVGDARTVITNNHVLEGCEADSPGSRVQVQAYDGATATGTTIRSFPSADVGVLQLAGALTVAVAQLRSDGSARVMESVVALGYPGVAQFAGVSGQQARATIGVVSRLAAQDLASTNGPRWVLEHGAPIYPGNSGGPLFDQCGAVLGINTFVPIDRQTKAPVATIAYAVGSRTIAKVASEVLATPLSIGAGECGQSLQVTTKQALVAENAKATPDSQMKAFFEKVARRSERWERDFENKAAARDSAIGDAIAMVGEQGANALRSSEGVGRRVSDLESKWERTEQGWVVEIQRQRLGIAIAALLAVLGIAGAVLAFRRSGVASEAARSAGDRADDALRMAERAMAMAERAAERRLDQRVRGEVSRIWSALDERPTYSARRMTPRERTRLVDQSTPSIGPALPLRIEDGAGARTINLRPGTTAYIGRDSDAMAVVAQRYLVPHVVVPIEEGSDDSIVSRCHCSVAYRDGSIEVVDLSSNGTYVEATGARLGFGQGQTVSGDTTLVLARRDSRYRVHVSAYARRPASVM